MNGSAALDPPKIRQQCPDSAGWLRGTCDHGNQRWIRLACKRRDCPICGELRKRRIAYRVQFGLQQLGQGGWFVGTFDYDIPKAEAVKVKNKFIRWLRRDQGINVEYAAVWELTQKGRLHLNLVLAPWQFIDQRTLSHKWVTFGGGMVVWIERVNDGIAAEVSKTYSKLGNYLAKFEQQVKQGRGICYSRGWPKPPDSPLRRKRYITWVWLDNSYKEAEYFEQELEDHIHTEVAPGEYATLENTPCDCFDFTLCDRPQKIPPVFYQSHDKAAFPAN